GAPLEKMGFSPGLIFYSYQYGVAKPSRRLFQLAAGELKKMGIEEEDALYVGNDRLNDILPAKTEGFQTALFAGDKQSLRLREGDSRCTGVIPDLVITALNQLKTYIA
ncbi:MAG: HAD family hydrolase, partial [Desulfobacterales bacterium]|nr:HAD family hydrolase [Desulfobacterales bacterium]